MNNNENICIGCKNIERSSFPFGFDNITKSNFIDTEGCGDVQEGGYYLIINFCPVCGKTLK